MSPLSNHLEVLSLHQLASERELIEPLFPDPNDLKDPQIQRMFQPQQQDSISWQPS